MVLLKVFDLAVCVVTMLMSRNRAIIYSSMCGGKMVV